MAIQNKAGTKTNTGAMDAGNSPCISPEGVRVGVKQMTPSTTQYFNPSAKIHQGPVAKGTEKKNSGSILG